MPGIAWPGLQAPLGRTLLALQFQLERTQWWPRDRLLEMQFRQVRALAQHAVATTPFYAGHLARAGIRSIAELDPLTWRRWPILSTRDVQARQADLLAQRVPAEHGPAAEKFTSGSTGMPKRIVASEAARLINQALVMRDHLWHRRDLSAKLCAIRFLVSPAEQRGWSPATDAAFVTGPAAAFNVAIDVDQQLEWLRWEKPAYLLTSPSNLAALIARSRETGRAPRELRQVMTIAEAVPAGLREAALAAWHVPLTDLYSCTEAGTLALQCPQAAHYHVQSEAAFVEVLREDGEPCEPGETGRVVATPLHNFAMPLLRYDIGDLAVAGERCACGRGLPVLQAIAGRVRNMARDRAGRLFQPGFDQSLEETALPVRQAQFIQRAVDAIEMDYVLDRDLTADERARFQAVVARRLPYGFRIKFRRVAEIARSPGGKYESFICALEPV